MHGKHIAARAHVATGSFYRYFRDKKAALLAVCSRVEQELGGKNIRYGNRLRKQGRSEQEVLSALVTFLRCRDSAYRVRDLDAAAELISCTIEEIAHRTILFDSYTGEQKLLQALQEMLTRYMFE